MSSTRALIFTAGNEPWEWRNVYLASGNPDRFIAALRAITEVTVAPASTPEPEALRLIRDHDILVSYAAPMKAESLEADRGRLRYICCLHGGVRGLVSPALLRSGLKVTNWGDHPGHGLAYLSMTMLLALLRDLPAQIQEVRAKRWRLDANCPCLDRVWGGLPEGLRVGVYGLGFAGRAFLPMARGMGFVLSGYDPYATPWPADVRRAGSLGELCTGIDALVICAAHTEETYRSVSRALLARLPDGGLVINTARGEIVDQDALFAELMQGRLRAGLDVLDPDHLDPDHPVRQLPNCILTCHVGPMNRFNNPGLGRNERYALENVRRFCAGEPLQWEIDEARFSRMT